MRYMEERPVKVLLTGVRLLNAPLPDHILGVGEAIPKDRDLLDQHKKSGYPGPLSYVTFAAYRGRKATGPFVWNGEFRVANDGNSTFIGQKIGKKPVLAIAEIDHPAKPGERVKLIWLTPSADLTAKPLPELTEKQIHDAVRKYARTPPR